MHNLLREVLLRRFMSRGLPAFIYAISTYNERHPQAEEQKDEWFLQVSFSGEGFTEHHPACSYLDFWYTPARATLEHVHVRLNPEERGKGLGRKLITAMESVGRELGCASSVVYINTNRSFWKHMGYAFDRKEKGWVKLLT